MEEQRQLLRFGQKKERNRTRCLRDGQLVDLFQKVARLSCAVHRSLSPDRYPLPPVIHELGVCNADPEQVRNPCCFFQFELVFLVTFLHTSTREQR